MTLWRDGVDAWTTLAAAGDVGPIRADILDKDYWATQVFRSLTVRSLPITAVAVATMDRSCSIENSTRPTGDLVGDCH